MRARADADEGCVTPGLRIPTTPAFARRLALLLALLGGLLVGLEATPARALVTESEGTKVGVQSPEIAHYWDGFWGFNGYGPKEHTKLPAGENPAVFSFANAAGNPVMHAVKTYAIYWDPEDYYHGDWQGLIDGFLGNLAGAGAQLGSVFAVDGQYTDNTNQPAATRSSFLGAYTDTNDYPRNECTNPEPFSLGAPLSEAAPTCLTDAQIKEQLADFIAGHRLRTGMGTIFYVLTPPGVAVCLENSKVAKRCSAQFSARAEKYTENGPHEEWEEIEEDLKVKQEDEENKKVYVEPASYKRFKSSFCSYHGAVGSGDESTILYAVIPWVAGDAGDYHLPSSVVPGYFCQDGGFAPKTELGGELEEKEREKQPSPKEEEEFAQKSPAEKREIEEAKAQGLDKPHDQEPNQIGLGPDGSYDTGLADLVVNQIAVEQQNTITDPLLDGWQDTAGNEVTDECRNFFVPTTGSAAAASPLTRAGTLANQQLGGKSYYLNGAFNLASLKLPYPAIPCLNGINLVPQFTAPVFASSGEVVGFDGMESNITLNAGTEYGEKGGTHTTYTRYTWNFGDGSEKTGYAPGAPPGDPSTLCELPWLPPCDASVFHSYQYGGTYDVTLTVKDVGGNIASVTHPVVVSGPPPPAPTPTLTFSGGAGSSGSSGSGGSGSNNTTQVLPAPVAKAAAASTSLKQVARHGLVVNYSVNEQVAGRFEVLLDAATANHLKIAGRPATKLPAGTPRSLVIGQALLVTTKAGRSSVRIKFSKSTANHLRHARKVTLMLRLTAHNASTQNPLFTTVLNTVVLHG